MTPTQAPWWANYALGGAILVVFAGALAASCMIGNDTLRTTMLTASVTLASMVAGYFFGSSQSSAKKDDSLAAANAALAQSTPVPNPPAQG